jgi:hypothetical protein
MTPTEIEAGDERRVLSTCRDFDDDCDEVPDKVHCYLHDPAKGMCPYLRARAGGE